MKRMISLLMTGLVGVCLAATPEELVDCPVSENVRGHENTEWSKCYSYHNQDGQKGLSRVLLVGDSICQFYRDNVVNALEGKTNVTCWASSYCVTSPCYMKLLEIALDEGTYDVVHFNNGCHSLSTRNEDWESGFRAALKLIQLKQPRARIVWASSTPNKDESKSAKLRELNAIALNVISELGGIAYDDLYALMDPLDRKTYWADNFHFTSAAIKMQSDQVVQFVVGARSK